MEKKIRKESLGFARFLRKNNIRPSADDNNVYFWEDSPRKRLTPSHLFDLYLKKDK